MVGSDRSQFRPVPVEAYRSDVGGLRCHPPGNCCRPGNENPGPARGGRRLERGLADVIAFSCGPCQEAAENVFARKPGAIRPICSASETSSRNLEESARDIRSWNPRQFL